jgi:hypothetical protein
MMQPDRILQGYKPLAVVGETLVLGRGRRIFLSSLDLTDIRQVAVLPPSSWRHQLAGVRVVDRVLRLSISTLVAVSVNHCFAVIGNEIWHVDLATGLVALDFVIPDGRKALALTILTHPSVGGQAVVFGEYFMSTAGPTARLTGPGASEKPVRVWFRRTDGGADWHVLAEFPADEIDHIHNVVTSANGKDILLLLGDIGPGVGIWRWNQEAQAMEQFQTGHQINRSTWVLACGNRLVYATDTQLEQNYLVQADYAPSAKPELTAPIAGSSIYSVVVRDGIVFSSSVEPGMPTGKRLTDIFEQRPGPGINGKDAVIYHYNPETRTMVNLFSAAKDFWPMRLGQFGTFMFPTGMDTLSDRFFAYGNAVARYDNCCLLFKRS